MRVEMTIRKGHRVATFLVLNSKIASIVGRGWADRGYFVTITQYP
jgi:hypothetical protein